MQLQFRLISCEFCTLNFAALIAFVDTDSNLSPSVNGQYASQGKLGAAVLGNHAKKEV
jgi:hypothetical protein